MIFGIHNMKTSKYWYKLIPKEYDLKIFDPDGWDRENYDYSFNEELITKKEFVVRVLNSTISCKFLTKFIHDYDAS